MKASEHQLKGLEALRKCMIENDIVLVKTANENKVAISIYDGSSDAVQFVYFSFEEEVTPDDIENKNYKIL